MEIGDESPVLCLVGHVVILAGTSASDVPHAGDSLTDSATLDDNIATRRSKGVTRRPGLRSRSACMLRRIDSLVRDHAGSWEFSES